MADAFFSINWGVTGLAGTLAYRVLDTADGTLVARTTTGVAESPAGSGIYTVTVPGWSEAWSGRVVWDDGTDYADQEFEANAVVGAGSPGSAVPVEGQGGIVRFLLGSTNTVEVDGLHLKSTEDEDTGVPSAYVNDATVVVEDVESAAGIDVTGTGVPITMTYVTGSDGTYRGNIPDAAAFSVGTVYRVTVKATSGSFVRRWKGQGHAIYGG